MSFAKTPQIHPKLTATAASQITVFVISRIWLYLLTWGACAVDRGTHISNGMCAAQDHSCKQGSTNACLLCESGRPCQHFTEDHHEIALLTNAAIGKRVGRADQPFMQLHDTSVVLHQGIFIATTHDGSYLP